jgi:hypothetical protein
MIPHERYKNQKMTRRLLKFSVWSKQPLQELQGASESGKFEMTTDEVLFDFCI